MKHFEAMTEAILNDFESFFGLPLVFDEMIERIGFCLDSESQWVL